MSPIIYLLVFLTLSFHGQSAAETGLDAVQHKCFNCGYMRKEGEEMSELPETAFCNDFAKPQDLVTTCPEGDCCASIREFFTKKDELLNSTYTQEIGRHGCESQLDKFTSHYKIECPDAAESKANCMTFTENLPTYNDTGLVEHAEVCFCNTDRCNDEDPIEPTIEPTTPKSGATNSLPSHLFFTIAFLALLELYKSR